MCEFLIATSRSHVSVRIRTITHNLSPNSVLRKTEKEERTRYEKFSKDIQTD